MALVFSSIAAANAEGSSDVTNLHPMPYFFKKTMPPVSSGHVCVGQNTFELIVCLENPDFGSITGKCFPET
jgi:hypothetical protein